MSYRGIVATIPLGQGGLNGDENLLAIPPTDLQSAQGVTFENAALRKMGGAVSLDAAGVSGDPAILAGHDWWTDESTQRTILACSDGQLYSDKTTPGDTDATVLATGLSTTARGVFVEAGEESLGADPKLIYLDGEHAPKVLAADGATAADLATPPDDWSGSNQPVAGLVHNNRFWAFLGHRTYYSATSDHENFTHAEAGQLACYPGVGRRIMCGLEHDEQLFCFKWPKGIFVLDDADVRPQYWKWIRASIALGVCQSPHAALEVPGDILFLSPAGSFHLLSEILRRPDAEGLRASDLSERLHIKGWLRSHINLARLHQVQSCWYEHKSLAIFALPRAGETANMAKLLFDFSRYATDGTVLFSYDYRDDVNALWLRREADQVTRPVAGDSSTGTVWKLDQSARTKDGAAYRSTCRTAETDFAFLDPSLASCEKNFDFLETIGTPKGTCSLPVTTYLDGAAAQALTFNPNYRTDKARIRGKGQYFSCEIDHNAAGEDFSLSAIRVYFRKGREVPVKSGGATAPSQETSVDIYRGYQDVAEGATSVTIAHASATGAYIPAITPSWNTAWYESEHLEGQFTITFAVPAPASAYVRWTITPASA